MADSSSIEKDVIDQAIAGDRAAIEQVCQYLVEALRGKFAPKVVSLNRASLDLDELISQSLAEILQCLPGFQHHAGASFLSWACRITEHNLTDALRGLERRPPAFGQPIGADGDSAHDLFDEITAGATSPSRGATRRELIELIRAAIAQLAEDHRFVIEKYDLERWPIEDVAAALSQREGKTVSAGAVFMRRGTACRKLARLIGNESNFF